MKSTMILAATFVGAAAFSGLTQVDPKKPLKRALPGGAVHGTVVVRTDSHPGGQRLVFAPDFELHLENRATGDVAKVRTDVYGRYYFPRQEAGTYLLRWPAQRGFAGGQFSPDLVLSNGEAYPPQIELAPQKGHVVLVGRVTFRNGDLTGFIQEAYGLIKTPVVEVRSPQAGTTLTVPADYRGDYAAGVDERSARAGFVIKATLDGGQGERELKRNPDTRGASIADVAIKNAAPRIESLTARDAGDNVLRHAQPGQKVVVEITANDADGDPLTAQWKEVKNLRPEPKSLKAVWVLPDRPGVYTIEAVVTDGRGGYSRGKLALPVGKKAELFEGLVVDKLTQRPLAGAEVEVNGTREETAKNGHFLLEVPLADRYVLNIRNQGYALASQTFDAGATGRVWQLVRRHTVTVDPTKEIVLTDGRKEWLRKNRLPARVVVPPNTLVYENGEAPKGPLSASIATLDIGDNEAPGDWAARGPDGRDTGLISYGVASAEFTDAAGRRLNVRKGSSARVEIPVATGRDGGRVLEQAPATIPVWSYNARTGYWELSGEAKLDRNRGVYVGEVKHFSEINMDQPGAVTCIRVLADPKLIGKTLKISDVAGDGIDYATVKEVVMNEPVNAVYRIPPNQKVRVEVLEAGAVVAGVVIEEFDTTAPHLGWQELTGNEVIAGPALTSLWPPYPYAECPKWLTLRLDPPGASGDSFLVYKGVGTDPTATNYYNLVSPGGAADPGNRGTLAKWWQVNGFSSTGGSPGSGADYHRTSYLNNNDLGSGRDMHFLRRADGTVAAYVSNYGKFNQDHINATLAFFQNNLGAPVATVCMEWAPMENAAGQRLDKTGNLLQQGPAESLAAFQQRVRDAALVKFFVYVDADGDGVAELTKSADLDGYGAKFVPNLCLNCHGGTPKSAAAFAAGNLEAPAAATRQLAVEAAELKARFRELDYETYKFALGRIVPTAAEKTAFRGQNDQVRSGNNDSISTAEIKNLIDLWYSGGAADIDQQPIVPAGWFKAGAQNAAQLIEDLDPDPATLFDFDLSAPGTQSFLAFAAIDQPENVYRNVVGKSCRTCHAAFGHDPTQPFNLNFHDYPQFRMRRSTIGNFITTTPASFVMPHAVITYRNFWLSGHLTDPVHRPTFLRQYQDTNWLRLVP